MGLSLLTGRRFDSSQAKLSSGPGPSAAAPFGRSVRRRLPGPAWHGKKPLERPVRSGLWRQTCARARARVAPCLLPMAPASAHAEKAATCGEKALRQLHANGGEDGT